MKNLLSEALRLSGEWMSTKRTATGVEILEEYLNPAAEYAASCDEQIRAYLTVGNFNERLFQNVKLKLNSDEWKQGGKVLADRLVEFEQCRQLQVSERVNRTPKDGVTLDVKALY